MVHYIFYRYCPRSSDLFELIPLTYLPTNVKMLPEDLSLPRCIIVVGSTQLEDGKLKEIIMIIPSLLKYVANSFFLRLSFNSPQVPETDVL